MAGAGAAPAGMRALLVGAGGHARAVAQIVCSRGHQIAAYCDPAASAWLTGIRHVRDDADARELDLDCVVMGLGGTDSTELRRRLDLLQSYLASGWEAPPVVHRTAIIADDTEIEPGATILAGAIVQPGARIACAAIVNSGAIVEHDCTIGAGAHVAPGAVVLGGARIGPYAMVGANAVVLPGAIIDQAHLVPAGRVAGR